MASKQHEIKLSTTQSFLESYSNLPKGIQKKTREFFKKFIENPLASSINYETIANVQCEDIRSVRIDQAYRGIILKPKEGNNYYLLWVDHHDEAYAWAQTRNINLNDLVGFEYIDLETNRTTYNQEKKTRLSNASISDLAKLGVPLEIIDDIRNINEIEEIENYKDYFTNETLLKLKHFLNGFEMSDVLNMKGESKQNPFVITEGLDETELNEILNDTVQQWRIFLHPKQLNLVQKDYNSSAKVIGAAGTGKTVIALHRAKYLHSKLGKDEKLLFTTYTKTLADDLRNKFKTLNHNLIDTNVEINNIDRVLSEYMKNNRMLRTIIMDTNNIWEQLETNEYSSSFLRDEWEQVILPNNIQNVEEYISIPRTNRYVKLDRIKRYQIWDIINNYVSTMKTRDLYDEEWAKLEVIKHINKHHPKGLFRFIIVDETQDMSAMSLQFIRALAGSQKENDIFLVGDSRQRIYRNINTLKKQGINVVGNSYTVDLNYRTTEEISSFAEKILSHNSFDDLDGNDLDETNVQSVVIGNEPVIKQCESFDSEILEITQHINSLIEQGAKENEICIALRTNVLVEEYFDSLRNQNFDLFRIDKDHNDNENIPGVRISTMHRIKGLEFSHMILPSLDHETMPYKHILDKTNNEQEKEYILKLEKSLLYVVLTRARFSVLITTYNKLTEFIEN